MMAAQEAGAVPARASARTSASDGRRGKPETWNGSNSYPCCGTSSASTRSGDPANVTRTPRSRSAAATASDGTTWPAVPPAAIRHASSGGGALIDRDVKEDADAREQDDEARAAVRDEREGDAGQRREPEHGGQVHGRLPAHERGDAGGDELPERISAAEGDGEARERERRERADDEQRADQPELLADDGEDHVGVGLGQVVDLLDALAESLPGEAARADADDRLHSLEAFALRVLPG